MAVVEFKALTKKYKNGKGIEDLSLSVGEGQVYGLLGPNGSGKTTALKALCGLVVPDSGYAMAFGKDPSQDASGALSRAGSLIEGGGFYPYLTVWENMKLMLPLYGKTAMNADEALMTMGLEGHRGAIASKLSLGLKQRLSIAMILSQNPDLLILDEPMNGLDIEGMALVRNIIKGLAKENKTVFMTSHLAYEIEQACTEIGVLKDGRLAKEGTVRDVIKEHGSVEAFYIKYAGKEK